MFDQATAGDSGDVKLHVPFSAVLNVNTKNREIRNVNAKSSNF